MLICHVVTSGIRQYIQASPMTLSAVGQNRTSSHIPRFMKQEKKSYQSQKMSTTEQVLPWIPPPTQRKLTNVRPSITSCWPFRSRGSQEHSFHLQKEDERGRNAENHRDKQSVTFSASPPLNEAVITQHYLTQIKDKRWIWMKSLWLSPALTHTRMYWFCSFLSTGWTWVHAAAAESHKASPQKTCERSEVESRSICSCPRPSAPQTHPFPPHYHRHRPVPMAA